MGLNWKGGLAGLGQGLQGLGAEMERDEQEEYRKERDLKADEIEERRYKDQREDAKLRNENLKMQMMVNRMQYDNMAMGKAAVTHQFDAQKLVGTLNNNGNTGYAFRYNESASEALNRNTANAAGIGGMGTAPEQAEKGIVYDVGLWQTDKDGNPLTGEDGKKIFKQLEGPAGQTSWKNKADYVNWYSNLQNPADMWARYSNEKTEAQKLEAARKMIEMKEATESGQADLAKTKAGTRVDNANAARLENPSQDKKNTVSEFTNVLGETVRESSQDVEKAKAYALELNRSGEFANKIDAKTSARIMNFQDSTDLQRLTESYLKTLNEDQFKAKFKEAKLPKEFVQKLWDEGEKPLTEQEQKSGRGFWDRFWAVFSE